MLESRADIDEIKDLLAKISTRIEAFVVSAAFVAIFVIYSSRWQYESVIRVEMGIEAILAVRGTICARE